MSEKDAALYQRVDEALTRYVEIVREMDEQQQRTEQFLHQGDNMVKQGKSLLRRLLELRRQLNEERNTMADFRQAVNRDCQGLRDGLELTRSQLQAELAQQKEEKEMLQRDLDAAAAAIATLARRIRLLTFAMAAVALSAIILSLL